MNYIIKELEFPPELDVQEAIEEKFLEFINKKYYIHVNDCTELSFSVIIENLDELQHIKNIVIKETRPDRDYWNYIFSKVSCEHEQYNSKTIYTIHSIDKYKYFAVKLCDFHLEFFIHNGLPGDSHTSSTTIRYNEVPTIVRIFEIYQKMFFEFFPQDLQEQKAETIKEDDFQYISVPLTHSSFLVPGVSYIVIKAVNETPSNNLKIKQSAAKLMYLGRNRHNGDCIFHLLGLGEYKEFENVLICDDATHWSEIFPGYAIFYTITTTYNTPDMTGPSWLVDVKDNAESCKPMIGDPKLLKLIRDSKNDKP